MCWALLCAPAASAQPPTLQSHIDAAVAAMQQLDDLAQACSTALTRDEPAPAPQACNAFLNGIDGVLVADYLRHCEQVNSWREQYIRQSVTANFTPADAALELRLLTGANYACGDNALGQHTQFVQTAFNLLQADSATSQLNTAMRREISELLFDARQSAERRRLLNSLQQQQLRRQHENDSNMRQLEIELIRQQQTPPAN